MNVNMPTSVLPVVTAQRSRLPSGALYRSLGLVDCSPLTMAQAPGRSAR
jgi:hypothetical protein